MLFNWNHQVNSRKSASYQQITQCAIHLVCSPLKQQFQQATCIEQAANILNSVSMRFIPHKKPQLRCWRRPLMVRQPYSVAVQSDEKERFPLFPWGEKTEMRGGAFFNGKEGRVDFRKNLRFKGGLVGFRKTLNAKGGQVGFRKKQWASNSLSNPWVKAGSSPHKKPQLCCWRRPLMVRQP